jgi:hypothetical protein
MFILIHSTTKIVTINGVPARIWEGRSHNGVKVHCYITRISVHKNEDTSVFERELQEHEPPSVEVEAIPLKLII